jgi:hypothetical protein
MRAIRGNGESLEIEAAQLVLDTGNRLQFRGAPIQTVAGCLSLCLPPGRRTARSIEALARFEMTHEAGQEPGTIVRQQFLAILSFMDGRRTAAARMASRTA